MIEKEIQTHHISYDPEITVNIPRKLHIKIHRHGTGPPKGVQKRGYSGLIVGPVKLTKIGGSFYIPIPKGWFETHNLDSDNLQELLVVANRDIRIVNPVHEEEVYKEISKIVKKVKI